MKKELATYTTTTVAKSIGVHSNTIRKYEELGFITKPARKPNGYRVFTELHLCQVKLIRTAFKVELVQNNLRKEALEIIFASAACDFDQALILTQKRHEHLLREHRAAEQAIEIASSFHSQAATPDAEHLMTRSEAAEYLSTTIDSLRNWEMNGLLQVKRRQNGYRVYNADDLNRLALIRALRMANYSLASIYRLLTKLEADPDSDFRETLNTPESDEDIISVCDRLIISLDEALQNSQEMLVLIKNMKNLCK